MTELERYKRAYATMLGQVDMMITSLEGVRELYKNDPNPTLAAMERRAFTESVILGLTKVIQDAEAEFTKPDPQEELRALGLKEGYVLVDDDWGSGEPLPKK